MLRKTIASGGWRALLGGLLAVCLCAGAASAQSFLGNTILAGATVSANSELVLKTSMEGYMLSDGKYRSLGPWYSSGREDVHLTMLTSLNDHLGILWGFGTGEQGQHYRIDPSVKLGFISSWSYGKNRSLALRMSVVVGGYLTETPCSANYGAIGGVQQVNCRMASSYLPPSQTLNYLFDKPPGDQVEASLTYKIRF